MDQKKRFAYRLVFTLLSIAAVGAIFYNSSLDAAQSSDQSDVIVDAVNSLFRSVGIPLTADSFIIRKSAHFTEYAVLGGLLSVTIRLYVEKRLRTLLIALPAGLTVAVCDELIQRGSAGRSCEARDAAIDFCGVLFAALIVQWVLYLKEKKKGKEGIGIERTGSE